MAFSSRSQPPLCFMYIEWVQYIVHLLSSTSRLRLLDVDNILLIDCVLSTFRSASDASNHSPFFLVCIVVETLLEDDRGWGEWRWRQSRAETQRKAEQRKDANVSDENVISSLRELKFNAYNDNGVYLLHAQNLEKLLSASALLSAHSQLCLLLILSRGGRRKKNRILRIHSKIVCLA